MRSLGCKRSLSLISWGYGIMGCLRQATASLPDASRFACEAHSRVGGEHGILGEALCVNFVNAQERRVVGDELEDTFQV